MSVEVRPRGVGCNLQCAYCYQDAARKAGNIAPYDREAVLKVLQNPAGFWSLFGGEALLLPMADLEELLALGHKQFGRTNVQTNGSLINDQHLELFKKYNTHVGFSIDGPDDLNDARWAGTLAGTRKMTARSLWALDQLLAVNPASVSLIVTIHSGNVGTLDRAGRLLDWFKDLDAKGMTWINLHLLELDASASDWALPPADTIAFVRTLWDVMPAFANLRVQLFDEILKLLRGRDEATACVWHACDPWNTQAVEGIEGDASPSCCTRTSKDGALWLPASGTGYATAHGVGGFPGNRFHERQLSLYVTPQEDGGCKDCRFWLMCQGQCPGTGEDADWRLRTADCSVWKGLFEEGERRLNDVNEQPISLRSDRQALEARLYAGFVAGQEPSMHALLSSPGNAPTVSRTPGHNNVPHGNVHGNHYDAARVSGRT